MRTEAAYLFRNKRAENLSGFGNARGVVLKGVGVQQACSCAVSKYQAVCRCTVMVAGGETLVMQSACAAGTNDYRLCASNLDFLGFHVHQHRTCGMTFVVLDDFDCCGEVHHWDTAVKHLVAQSTHNFRAAVVLAGVHTFAACSAAVSGNHVAVGVFVKHYAEVAEPHYCVGCFVHQLFKQFGLCGEVTATECVEIVDCWAVVGFVRRLNTAFRHHRVGVADTQFGDNHYVCAVGVCHDCRACACTAAADHKHVGVVVGIGKVDVAVKHARLTLQKVC